MQVNEGEIERETVRADVRVGMREMGRVLFVCC